MNAAELAQRLNGHKTPRGWKALCPAHEDHNPSLDIAEGKGGCVIVKCRAGCSQDAVIHALRNRGLWPESKRQQGELGRHVATYPYTDADGALLFEVWRYDPKNFRQRRPDPDKPGRWIWNMNGQSRVLYRLPAILKAKAESRVVFVAEGEKAVDALVSLKLAATCSPGGAGKWQEEHADCLAGAQVIVLPDNDAAGRKHAALVLRTLTGKAKSVRVVELPNLPPKGDAYDWVAAGGTQDKLRKIIATAPVWTPPAEEPPTANTSAPCDDKPAVILPRDGQTISEAGRYLGKLLAQTQRFFTRGAAVVKLSEDVDGLPRLDDVKPAALASDFETVAALVKMDGETAKPTTCPEQTAKLIAASAAFREALPPIHVLTRCPVLIERAGSLMQVSGYDRESGIFAAGKPAEPLTLDEARALLSEMLDGFRFVSQADRARALAAMITPALVFGGLLRGRAPVDLGEADQSQTGKGYRNKLTAALYAQSVKTVAQQKGGPGSMEESFDMALIRGANFICLDNVRGHIDSPRFESFLTEDTYTARAAYVQPTEIDPRRVVCMMTSNNADFTRDLSNRSSCVRIVKQPDGTLYKSYPEGDILEHVRAEQPRYLGAVFAVAYAWYAAGKPKTTETRHDFRPWAQTLDWITRNLLDAGPLLDGHRETQERMTNPVLGWLRDVALAAIRAKQSDAWLRAGDILDLIAETDIETPGLPEHADPNDPASRKTALQVTGKQLSRCFRAGGTVTVDSMIVEKREGYDPEGRYTVKEYRFSAAANQDGSAPAKPVEALNNTTQPASEAPENTPCGYSAANPAANPAADKTLAAANAANTPLQTEYFTCLDHDDAQSRKTMAPISRIAATPAEVSAGIDYEEGEIT